MGNKPSLMEYIDIMHEIYRKMHGIASRMSVLLRERDDPGGELNLLLDEREELMAQINAISEIIISRQREAAKSINPTERLTERLLNDREAKAVKESIKEIGKTMLLIQRLDQDNHLAVIKTISAIKAQMKQVARVRQARHLYTVTESDPVFMDRKG